MINPSNSILIFNDHVIDCSDKFILFGQYLEDHFSARDIKYLVIKNKLKETVSTRVILHRKRNDFYIIISDSEDLKQNKYDLYLKQVLIARDITLKAPFDTLSKKDEQLPSSIITMVQNYSNRITEWIEYHIKLGFSQIIIFDNNSTDNTSARINGINNPRVIAYAFNYEPLEGQHWANIQRMQLTIGKMALDGKADWLCFIDADEFIYLPKMQRPDINAFLRQRKYKRAKALRIESILLTNKAQDDLIENNILELCRHSDLTAKYTKLIINSKLTRKTTFMKSPHKMRGDSILRKEDMYHGHCWCNQRLEYVHSMEQLDVLYNFFKS